MYYAARMYGRVNARGRLAPCDPLFLLPATGGGLRRGRLDGISGKIYRP